MKLGFRPPDNPEEFLAYVRVLAGRYSVVEVPGHAAAYLMDAIRKAKHMGFAFCFHARYLDLYPGSPVEEIRKASLKLLQEDLERAARIEAFRVIVHAGNIPWTDYPPPGLSPAHDALRAQEARLRRAYLGKCLESFSKLASLAADLGIRIALENLAAPQEVPRTAEEMALFLQIPHLEFCLDLGHAKIAGQNPRSFFELLGNRLTHVHAHSNDGHFDVHLPPSVADLKLFSSHPCTVVIELPPRNIEEYLEVHKLLVSENMVNV